tara:strand:- start:594 stop:935 length:342 start_codon:yes stop_codon:yes gene_type:complete
MKKTKLNANPIGKGGLFTLNDEGSEQNGQQIYLWTKDFEPLNRLKVMQEFVGGYIERYPAKVAFSTQDGTPRECEVLVNEEGLINGLPINEIMQDLYDIDVCGNVILIEGGLD